MKSLVWINGYLKWADNIQSELKNKDDELQRCKAELERVKSQLAAAAEQPTLLVYVEGGVVQGVSGTTDKIRVIIQDVDNEPRFEGDDLTDEPEIEVLELDDLWCKLRDNVPE